ncbi:MAG: hypothetical protein A3J83_06725 [Elusimicrobia bacterium RIFOXYA2_FULL_40_6]|nr:MAG: hypothetical protein A3J83_06725 [Elusimicrobia bacterium RIFOXYA2_FULL_40_6]
MISLLFLLTVLPSVCPAFEVAVYPDTPKGGEGFLLTVKDNSNRTFNVIYKNKAYPLYNTQKGIWQLLLPVEIEDSGPVEITVRKKLLFITLEEIKVPIIVRNRKINTVSMGRAYEKIRDAELSDSSQPQTDGQQEAVLRAIDSKTRTRLFQNSFIIPVKSKSAPNFAQKRVGGDYCYFHKGIDLGAKRGTNIRASNDGIVVLSENNFTTYGNLLIIDHGQGVVSCYFHLQKLFKKKDDVVKRNEIIAKVGNTGLSTAPHLHFGIYLQGTAVDPCWFTSFSTNLP